MNNFSSVFLLYRGLHGGSKRKKQKDPFREALGRVKDHWSVLPGIPSLALTAAVQNNGRAKLTRHVEWCNL